MKSNNNDAIYKLCNNIHEFIQKNTESTLNLYEVLYKDLLSDIELLLENEPFKLFKTSHKKWEEELNNKKRELYDIERKIIEELKTLKD